MKLTVRILTLCAMLLLLGGCNGNRRHIDLLVEEINSPVFRAKETKTGLFDDSEAKVEGSQLIIRFLCRPFINLAAIAPQEYSQLEKSAVEEFRSNLIDDNFRLGLEALRNEKMTLLLCWEDVNGFTIKIPVNPAEILE